MISSFFNIKVDHSYFARQFSYSIYNTFHTKIVNTVFHNSLKTAIKIDNSDINGTIEERQNFSDRQSLIVSNAYFYNISSSEEGGAISYTNGMLSLSNSVFDKCTTLLNGGAIFGRTNHSIISNVCFYQCSSDRVGQALYIYGQNKSPNQVKHCSIVRCSSSIGKMPLGLNIGTILCDFINSTGNEIASGATSACGFWSQDISDDIYYKNSLIMNSGSGSLFAFQGNSGIQYYLDSCNAVSNKAKSFTPLINWLGTLTITNSRFIGNGPGPIVNIIEGSAIATFKECEIDTQFPASQYVFGDSNQFGVSNVNTLVLDFLNTAECYAPDPATTKYELSGGAIAGIVIACVAFVVIIALIFYCVCHRSHNEENITA